MVTRVLNVAASGMGAQEYNIEVISNNIANMNTIGFKRDKATFQDLIYNIDTRAGSISSDAGTMYPTGIYSGMGVKVAGTYKIHEVGDLIETKSDYDVVIKGQGFFRIQLPDGEAAYTRAGSFQLNPDLQIVTPEGYLVEPGINIPQDALKVHIDRNGQIFAYFNNIPEPDLVGQFELVDFPNPAGLNPLGNNLLSETAASGPPVAGVAGVGQFGGILQGWYEHSNVNPVTEITGLIFAQRAYELNSKTMESANELLRVINNLKS